ncbi:response regulator [Evansella tamaricis]|uniref:Response regulator n=1 Tax=Evansella tamaricis TaxID=2069301 RepID=A0ABS6JLX1_9BACI|nr:response regulator [Evansella tamaricis]MBU9714670.1 response regulator [Evansella tamaricis]
MAKKKILISEHDTGIQGLLKLYLESKGYHILLADSSEQTIALVHSDKPELIIFDIEMPTKNGWDKEEFKSVWGDIPVLYIGYREVVFEQFISTEEDKGSNYLIKPFEFNTLLIRIKEIL